MKPFLILQLRPEDETADNEFEAFLKYGKLKKEEVERIRVEQFGIPTDINLDNYSGIIVGGSPFDISTPQNKKSKLQTQIEKDFSVLLDKVTKKDFPFLGACSGSGLLGNYCGANISSKYAEPVHGIDVYLTQEGKKDPLLTNLPNTFRALVGHKEACDTTPPDTKLLITSKECPVQMFRFGENVYATQFHPEADASVFELRIRCYKHHGYFKPEQARQLINTIKREKAPVTNEILRRFVARYKQK